MNFTVAGSEAFPICRLDPPTMNMDGTEQAKKTRATNVLGAQMSAWCVWVLTSALPCTLYCLFPSLLRSVSVLSGSDTVLSVWFAGYLLSRCHQAGLLVFIVVFVVFSFLSVVSRLCSLVKSVQSVLPVVVCFFFRGCGTTSR